MQWKEKKKKARGHLYRHVHQEKKKKRKRLRATTTTTATIVIALLLYSAQFAFFHGSSRLSDARRLGRLADPLGLADDLRDGREAAREGNTRESDKYTPNGRERANSLLVPSGEPGLEGLPLGLGERTDVRPLNADRPGRLGELSREETEADDFEE